MGSSGPITIPPATDISVGSDGTISTVPQGQGPNSVSQIDRSQSGLQVHVFQTDEPDQGSVSLIFIDNPLQLTHWTVTDANNQQVSTGLYDVQTGIDLPAGRMDCD